MKQPIFRDKHLYILLAFFIVCTLFYYFGELVNFFGWEALRWDIFYTVHDLHRLIFLVPILYSSYYYRSRGALLANISSLLIFLPRAFFIAPYYDATLRMIAFIIMAAILSALTVMLVNRRDKLNMSVKALKRSEEKYRLLVETASEVILVVQDLKIKFFNHRAVDLTGYTSVELNDMPFANLVYPDDLELLATQHQRRLRGEPFERVYPFRYVLKEGKIGWAEINTALIDWEGKPATLSFLNDITERKQAEEELSNSEEKYRSLIENINDVFYSLDTQGNISYVSPVVERLSQYKVSELIGKPFIPLIYPDDLPALLDSFNRLMSGLMEPSEFRIVDKDGRIIYVHTSSRPLYKDGVIVGVTALLTDITERKQLQQKLEEMATHDYLTGLPNRVLLTDRFSTAAALARRNKTSLAVMSLDLDKFKTINDTLGHEAGDQVLRTVSARLANLIRASDTLARVGGDEFVLVMQETKHKDDATIISQKILDAFTEPLPVDGHQVYLSTSIGIAIYPEDAEDMETLIKKSDAAMYYSKGHGRNRFKFFCDGDVRMGADHKSGPLIRG